MDSLTIFFRTTEGMILSVVILVLLASYISGILKSRQNKIVIISGYKDYITLIVALLSIPISIFLQYYLMKDDLSHFIIIIGAIITFLSICLTLYFSITSNKGNIQNILTSFFAKLFIILIFTVLFIIRTIELINADSDKHKNRRYKDGTKGNLIISAHNRNRKFTDLLIRSLIKN